MTTHTASTSGQGHTANSTPRRIYNPVQKDYATFLETSAETNGQRTLIEIELAPGGGNRTHYHLSFAERFEVLEGELQVLLGKATQLLTPGQTATAPPNTLHCFSNPTNQTTRFLVELRPGHTGFEQALQIAYGLAADGKTNRESLPTNPYHMAILFTTSEGMVPGVFALLTPVFRFLAARARKLGIEQELIRKYCR
ncbi:MAG: cupin domain-containing protein [Chloroflexaceae bacterium]|jgi:mannose-6-phosphate isomerase-like protein (cupin superfamily)|nr:cupin domain-containing protein [Chloroflexaceae bacterium]